MKKIFKVLIALVIIVVIAVGAYFIFSNKTDSKLIYKNVYSLENEITAGNVNVVEKVNEVIDDLPDLVVQKQISGLDSELTYFSKYSRIYNSFEFIGDEIIENSVFIKSANKKFVNNASKKLKEVKTIYTDAYNYLNNTYFAVINGTYTNEQMKVYIQNFYLTFKEINTNITSFYLNTALAYAHGLDNTISTNSLYKLNVEFYGQLINYLVEQDGVLNDSYYKIVNQVKDSIDSSNLYENYFANKNAYDVLISKSVNLNFEQIISNYLSATVSTYYESLEDETEKQIVKDYYYLVMGVNV